MAESKTNKSDFDVLNAVNVSDKTETKNKFTYLSWAWAWGEVKKKFPTATFEYIKSEQGLNYHHDGRTAWVEVAVEINGIRYEEHLPVMDYNNRSIPLEKITSFDVNKAQKRCLVKCIAMHGLGLYIYAGEDLPEDCVGNDGKDGETAPKRQGAASKKGSVPKCSRCSGDIVDYGKYTAGWIADESTKKLGKPICMKCWIEMAEAKKNNKMDGEYQALMHEDAGDRV